MVSRSALPSLDVADGVSANESASSLSDGSPAFGGRGRGRGMVSGHESGSGTPGDDDSDDGNRTPVDDNDCGTVTLAPSSMRFLTNDEHTDVVEAAGPWALVKIPEVLFNF